MIVAAQRTAVDDVPGRLTGWTVLSLPAEDELGEPLAPNVLPRERLDAIKAQIGSLAYACQYLQRPTDDSAAVLKRSWWRFYARTHADTRAPRPAGCDTEQPAVSLPEHFERVVIAADLTFGSTTGDWAVAQAWGAAGGGCYLLEQWRARAGFEASLDALRAMAARHPGCKVLVEKAANGAAIIESLQKAIPGVVAMKPRGSKRQRAAAVAPAVESGACYLPLGWPGLVEFVEELAGASNHDDMLDATAYALADLANAWSEPEPAGGYVHTVTAADGPPPGIPISEGAPSAFAPYRRRVLVGGCVPDGDG